MRHHRHPRRAIGGRRDARGRPASTPPLFAEAAKYRCVDPFRVGRAIDQKIYFGSLKPGHFQVKVDFCANQLAPEDLQLIDLPVGIEGDFVVGKRESGFLLWREVRDAKNGHGLQARHPGSLHSAMADENDTLFIDNDEAVETEFPDGRGDLIELLLGMSPGVTRVGPELSDGQLRYMEITHLTPPVWRSEYISSI
jgi:hypothetical protein